MRFYYRPTHPKANERGFVSEADLDEEPVSMAVNAGILSGRMYENLVTWDTHEDIGSRKKRREYMKRNGLADTGDFKGVWAKAEEQRRVRREELRMPDPKRREALERAFYKIAKP